MTAAIEWPPRATRLNPVFAAGQDWIANITPTEGSSVTYPEGTAARFVIYDSVTVDPENLPDELLSSDATVTSTEINFKIESALCDGIPANKAVRIFIQYPNTPSTDDLMLAKGKVVRDD